MLCGTVCFHRDYIVLLLYFSSLYEPVIDSGTLSLPKFVARVNLVVATVQNNLTLVFGHFLCV